MKIVKHHSILFTTYILFLAGLVLAYRLTLGAVIAAAMIGLIVARHDVIENAGAAANRRLGRLLVVVSCVGLGAYLACEGDGIGLVALCLLGALCLLPSGAPSSVGS